MQSSRQCLRPIVPCRVQRDACPRATTPLPSLDAYPRHGVEIEYPPRVHAFEVLSIFGRYRAREGTVKSSKAAECESESPAIFFAVVTRVSTVECDYWKSPHEQ
jgi:hypothetical protein